MGEIDDYAHYSFFLRGGSPGMAITTIVSTTLVAIKSNY